VALETGNYRIFTTENGQQTLDLARAKHPDVILLDVKMPGSEVDGLTVCRELKADPTTKEIYIIIVSARGQQDEIAAGLKAGADDYLVKPFSLQLLLEKIAQL
jgi:DNA-binding response OmpR family regulator